MVVQLASQALEVVKSVNHLLLRLRLRLHLLGTDRHVTLPVKKIVTVLERKIAVLPVIHHPRHANLHLPAGVYLVRLQTGSATQNVKLVVE